MFHFPGNNVEYSLFLNSGDSRTIINFCDFELRKIVRKGAVSVYSPFCNVIVL